MIGALAWLGGLALGAPGLADAGGWSAGEGAPRPAALLVLSPGLRPEAGDPLARALERAGWDAWRLDLADTDPALAERVTLPEALTELEARGRPVLIVGEGLGGRIAARSAEAGRIHPAGLALLGAPLDLATAGDAPVALVQWMAALPVPEAPLDLASLSEARWQGAPALGLLLGDPLPPLGALSPAWLAALAADVADGAAISLLNADFPVFAAASPSDNLGPPESVRWRVPEGSFLRLGLLNLDPREPDHAGLLTDPASARALLRWARPLREGAP